MLQLQIESQQQLLFPDDVDDADDDDGHAVHHPDGLRVAVGVDDEAERQHG